MKTNSRTMWIAFGILLVLLCLARPAISGGPLLFIGDDDFPPYSFSSNGHLQGIDVEIIEEMARRMKLDVTIRLVPWKRLIKMTQEGTCDGAFSLFHTLKRESIALYAFSQPVHISRFPLFFKKGKSFQFNTIEDLYGKTIGINRGFSISPAFDRAVEEGKIIVNIEDEVDENIFLTVHDRIDGFTNNADVTRYKIKNLPRLKPYEAMITHTGKYISEHRKAYFVLSRNATAIQNKPEMLEQINMTLDKMKKEGIFHRIHTRYLE